MGKPILTVNWSNSGNYPAGGNAWNAQPLSVTPSGTWFTPGTFPAAENLNWLFGNLGASGDMGNVLNWCGMDAALDWGQANGPLNNGANAPLAFNGIAWDNLVSRWLTVVNGGTLAWVVITYGNDPVAYFNPSLTVTAAPGWIQTITFPTTAGSFGQMAVCADPTTSGTLWVAGIDNTLGSTHAWLYNGASWTREFDVSPGGSSIGIELCTLGAYVIVAVANTTAADSFLMSSNNQVTWLPNQQFTTTAFTTTGGTNNYPGRWLLKSNGSMALAISSQTSVYQVWKTTDGHTWASNTGLSSLLAAGNTITGLCWTQDLLGPCWLVSCIGAGGVPFFYRSTDGVTWTAQAGGMTKTYTIGDLAAIGSLVVGTQLDSGATNAPSSQVWSPDGGVTWYQGQANFQTNLANSNAYESRSKVVASGAGFGSINALWCRFSSLQGTGPNRV